MKIFLLMTLLMFICDNAYSKIEAIIGNQPVKVNKNFIGSIPQTKRSEIIISRNQYIISFNKYTRSPNWTIWKVTKDDLGDISRSNNFKIDQDLKQYFEKYDSQFQPVHPSDYKGSCFDRGHQAPSGDRTANREDNDNTFLMSNMAPQTPYLNRVLWQHLETYTRKYISVNNLTAYIITGPIYDKNLGSIGPNLDIKIPSKFFKIIYFVKNNANFTDINRKTPSISVVIPNQLKDGTIPDANHACEQTEPLNMMNEFISSEKDWEQYQEPIDQIEQNARIKI